MQSVSPRWQQSCQEKEVGVADASFPHATNQLPPIVIQDEGEPSIGPQSSAQRHRVHADRTVCSKADEGIVFTGSNLRAVEHGHCVSSALCVVIFNRAVAVLE